MSSNERPLTKIYREFWHSDGGLILLTRVFVLFVAFFAFYMVGSWGYYEFMPVSTFFTYYDVVGVGLNEDGSLVVESDRLIKRSGLYQFNDVLTCIVGDPDGVGWQGVAKAEEITPAVAAPRHSPPLRWTFRASVGIWGQGNVTMPALCRFRTIVTLRLPRGVTRSQALIGSEFLVSDNVVADQAR